MLISIAQAIAWICARDVNAVIEIGALQIKDQLFVAMQRWRRGYDKWIRPRASLSDGVGEVPHFAFKDEVKFASSAQALAGITAAIWTGLIAVHVTVEGEFRVLTDVQLAQLSLRTCEPGTALGLWHGEDEVFAHMNPQLLLRDVENRWPAPAVSSTMATTNRIERALRDLAKDGHIRKKTEAMDLMKKQVPDFGRRRFEAAWRNLPAEYKVPRGKRGRSVD